MLSKYSRRGGQMLKSGLIFRTNWRPPEIVFKMNAAFPVGRDNNKKYSAKYWRLICLDLTRFLPFLLCFVEFTTYLIIFTSKPPVLSKNTFPYHMQFTSSFEWHCPFQVDEIETFSTNEKVIVIIDTYSICLFFIFCSFCWLMLLPKSISYGILVNEQ